LALGISFSLFKLPFEERWRVDFFLSRTPALGTELGEMLEL
jgi:hypothetical protein